MKKIAYIVPGYGGRRHKKLADIFKRHGIEPIFVKIDWEYDKPAKFQHFVDDFLAQYEKPKGTKVYVFGFSFGARVAFLGARETNPDVLILGSLSPWFTEDFKTMEPSWVTWWKKNFIESDVSFDTYAKAVKSKTYLLVGSKEEDDTLFRSRDAAEKISKSELIEINGAEHNISQKAYLDAIEKVVSSL